MTLADHRYRQQIVGGESDVTARTLRAEKRDELEILLGKLRGECTGERTANLPSTMKLKDCSWVWFFFSWPATQTYKETVELEQQRCKYRFPFFFYLSQGGYDFVRVCLLFSFFLVLLNCWQDDAKKKNTDLIHTKRVGGMGHGLGGRNYFPPKFFDIFVSFSGMNVWILMSKKKL